MTNVRRNVLTLAVALATTLVGGCTFGEFARVPRERQAPIAPCCVG
jgi:hypothetical protein